MYLQTHIQGGEMVRLNNNRKHGHEKNEIAGAFLAGGKLPAFLGLR